MWRRQKSSFKNNLKPALTKDVMMQKRVRWYNYVDVRYIPSRHELKPFFLWYDDYDYVKFKLDYEKQFGEDKYYTM